MFMTCSTSYCLVTLKDLWNVYMYICMYVSMSQVKTLKMQKEIETLLCAAVGTAGH